MKQKMENRFNGIIELGDHLVLLYESESNITETVVSYISNSLNNNRKFIYITGDTDTEMVINSLKQLNLYHDFVKSNQLVFLDKNDAYSKEGKFNPEKMKDLLIELSKESQKDGYEGLAISGEISWVLEYDKGFDLINEYEWKINFEVFGTFPVTALCRYNMDKFTDEMIINVIQLHPFLIIENNVHENPFYIPAIAYETNDIPKYQVKTWLENIVKFSSTKSDFSERLDQKEKSLKQAIMTLEYEKNLAQMYLDVAGVMLMVIDTKGNIKLINKRGCEVLGLEEDLILGKNWFDNFIPKNIMNNVKILFDDVFNNISNFQKKYENTIIDANGEEKIIYWNNTILYDEDDKIIGILSSGEDVTEIKVSQENLKASESNLRQEQEELRKNEKKIRLLLDSTMEGIYGVDVDGVCTFINKSALEILGYQMDELIGKNMHEILHHSYSDGSIHPIEDCRMKKFILAENTYSGEDILWCKDSSFIYVERLFKPLIIDKKIQGGIMMFRDITEGKRNQEILKASESNLRQAQEIGKIGSWELTLKDNKIWASEEAFKIYGLPGKNEYIDFLKVHNMTTKEDQNRLAAELEGLILNNKPYEITFKLNTDDGKTKFIYSRASLINDVHGKPEKVIGVIRDITDTIQKELELEYAANNDFLTGIYNRRYYEENLAKLDVKENYPLTIIMSDINGLKLINDAFGHKSGDELLISAVDIMRDSCSEKGLLARIGGDEFVMVLPNTNRIETEEIIKNMNKKADEVEIESIPLSISFGYGIKRLETEDIQEVFRSAEDAMYRQKLMEIPSMRSGAIETILTTLYEKDKNSEVHSRTVSDLSERLAKAYGMDRQDVAEVKTAGLLHDIGKIIISETILKKEGELTTEEYESIKTHPEIGFRILNSASDMRGIANIILNHHERWDGKGYPRGIKSDEIPLKSRIISIADAFDAMTSERTYRDIISKQDALKEIIDNSGTQFDPKLVEAFRLHFDDIIIDL